MALTEGERFPDAVMTDQSGAEFDLASMRGGPAVVYFYPRDDTPGCTAEACSFRDQYEAFTDRGAAVVGISDDSPRKHAEFAAKHNLPFTLLSDRKGAFRKRIKVPTSLGIIPGRVTYVLDADGIIVKVFNSQTNATAHIDEALAALAT